MQRSKSPLGLLAASALALSMAAAPAFAKSTANDGIALSNSYAGNSWRQQMLKMWTLASQDAVHQHVIAKTKVVNSNNSASQQEAQIEDLILQGWQAIVIDAASPTALNGVIAKACRAGIVVVVFDSLATAPCAYKVAYNYVKMGTRETNFVAQALNSHANLLEVRGVAGTSVDQDIHQGIVDAIKKNQNLKLVGSVHGNWTESIAQKQVAGILPSLPPVQAVVTQGGDGYGTYEAFKSAGRPVPLIIMGNRQDELALWAQLEKQKGGYHTISMSSAPGVSSIAFWVAQRVLAGETVPKLVNVPLLIIHADDLDNWLKVMVPGSVATPLYSQSWTEALIKADLNHAKPPASPQPTKLQ